MKNEINKISNSMNISDQRLTEFIKLFEHKNNQKLPEKDALARASALLGTISALFQPVSRSDYYSAMARKLALKNLKQNK